MKPYIFFSEKPIPQSALRGDEFINIIMSHSQKQNKTYKVVGSYFPIFMRNKIVIMKTNHYCEIWKFLSMTYALDTKSMAEGSMAV